MPKAQPPAARSGTRKLSEVARHLVQPSGIVRTGWPAVERTCREKLGVVFDGWQAGAGRLILAEREDGSLAATVGGVGMSVPRQVGKTFLLAGMIFGLCINRPGLLVIWSAHHAKTHNETFLSMQAFAARSRVAPYVGQVFKGSGDEEIRFRNGSRILFGARERGFGRGIPGVDILVMDEGQILSERAMDNMLATLNTSKLGMHLYVGTPPKPEDNSDAFTRMRTEALAGDSDDTVWIECGADPDFKPTPLPAPLSKADLAQIAKANPSVPHRTPLQSIRRLRKKLTAESLRREAYGIWDDVTAEGVFSAGAWGRAATEPTALPPAVLGVAADLDQTRLCLGASTTDGEHVGSVLRLRFDGQREEFVREVARISREHQCPVAVDVRGPASPVIPDLELAGVDVRRTNLDDLVGACVAMRDAVETRAVHHGDYTELNEAVAVATWRTVGDRRVFGRKGGDISMLEAVTLARWVATEDTGGFNIW